MIRAEKSRLWHLLLTWYVRRLVQARFFGMFVWGAQHYRDLPEGKPALCVANHTCWWDGLTALLLDRLNPRRRIYCMMEERQLRDFRFFTKLGAFGVDLSAPGRAAVALKYAHGLLSDPRALVWMFPQGRLTASREPVSARRGAAWLAQRREVQCVPVAFRFEFLGEDRPHLMVRIGAARPGVEATDEGTMAGWIQAEVDALDRSIVRRELGEAELVVPPRLSLNKRWLWVKLAATGRLKEFRPYHD